MRQLVYTSFLLIITLHLTCGAREICSTIKKSQNIMNMTELFFINAASVFLNFPIAERQYCLDVT